MSDNNVTVSDDGHRITICTPAGVRTTLHSARPAGFTAAELHAARATENPATLLPGQINRVRRWRLGTRSVYLHINTGPPTWWRPRVQVTGGQVMLGWLHALIAVAITREAAIRKPVSPLGDSASPVAPPGAMPAPSSDVADRTKRT